DVPLLAVGVVEERDARGAVRIVLDAANDRRHAVLVALEVDQPVPALVAAATVICGDAPGVAAAAGLLEWREQRALRRGLRDLGEVVAGLEAATGGRGTVLDGHPPTLPRRSRCASPRPGSRRPSSNPTGGPSTCRSDASCRAPGSSGPSRPSP